MDIEFQEWERYFLSALLYRKGKPIDPVELIYGVYKIENEEFYGFLSDLREKGYIDDPEGKIRLTLKGREYVESRYDYFSKNDEGDFFINATKEDTENELKKESNEKVRIELPDETKKKVPKSTQDFLIDDLERLAKEDLEKQKSYIPTIRHLLSNSENDQELLKRGYKCQGLIGYASKTEQGAFKIIRYFSLDYEDDVQISIDTGWEEKLETHRQENLGFTWAKKEEDLIRLQEYTIDFPSYPTIICTNPKLTDLKKLGYNFSNSSEHFLSQSKSENRIPLYVYSTHPEILLFEPLDETNSTSEFDHDNDLIPDSIAKEDELGRKNLMKVIHKKVKDYWANSNEEESFTLLINGEWGSGKSSMLYYLKDFLESKEENDQVPWTVVEYNAWRNQRFEDPWWIFVNKVSKEVPTESSSSNYTSHSHRYWKNSSRFSITYIVAFITSLLLIFGFSKDVFGDTENISFYASILALLGTLWVAINGAIQNIFQKKSFSELQVKNANDPLEPYKKRFEEVVKEKKVAIFIDDLDRCEVEATVKLLEGIQTLFKDCKVLYVVAADGHWVSNCFDKKYEDFSGLTSSGQSIGNQFLQKTFQLVVDVPKINKKQVEKLLRKHLGRLEESAEGQEEEIHVSEEEISTITDEVKLRNIAAKGDESTRVAATQQIGEATSSKKSQQELQHYILEFQKKNDLPLNPRQIKRLINLYTMKTEELSNSQVSSEDVSKEMILNYVLFSTEYAACNQHLRTISKADFDEKYKDVLSGFEPLTYDIIRDYF